MSRHLQPEQMKKLLIRSRTEYQPYRNIRYLRKFAAMFMLGDREIWKDLLKLKKELKEARKLKMINQSSIQSNQSQMAGSPQSSSLKQDKSVVDDEKEFDVTVKDREYIEALLENEQIRDLLYSHHGIDRINILEQKRLQETLTTHKADKRETIASLSSIIYDKDTGFERRHTAHVQNMQDCKPGTDQFLKIWSRLPLWWEPLHDRILLELALMHKLDVDKFYQTLDDDMYYQDELEDHYYKAFEFWCSQKVNVQHRLRFLLYVIDNKRYPDSMVFLNDIMKVSHLKSFEQYNKNIEEKVDSPRVSSVEYDIDEDERPVRDIEREFRDIVQLLEPEALGIRIWRFIMNQMAAKQRKSLWRALTILAEELPSNMILMLLEEDRDLLRRGKPKYVNAVCQSIIKGSNHPIATALHLARYMEENANSDLARTMIWRQFSDQYEAIAISLVNDVESDHLLALLLEIPTDIQQQTIIQIAVLYQRVKFINSARIQGVMTHMWSESEYLNPQKPVRTTYLTAGEFYKLLWKC